MSLFLSPVCNDQTFDANGDPLNAGQIETYLAGSSTPAATYTDDTGATPHSNPIILNSLGYATQGSIWLDEGVTYKFIIKDALGVTLRTIDDISGVNDASVSQSEWVASGFVPTFINATSFSVPGDQTAVLQINRRLRTTNTSGFIYSTITNSVFAAGITTVTVVNDSGSLDAGLSAVAYGLLSATNRSIPLIETSGIADEAVTLGKMADLAAGNFIVGDSSGRPSALTPGADGSVIVYRSASAAKIAQVAALNKQIYGLTYSNNVTDPTNDIDIAAGGCFDGTNAYWIQLSAITKRLDAAWAVGTNQGGLDTGAVADSGYYIWAIARSDTGVTDALFSLSSTAPTMPANYDYKRLIGWIKRESGAIASFLTYETFGGGIEYLWQSPTLDINLSNTLAASRRTDAIRVPLNFSVEACLNIRLLDAAAAGQAIIYCPDLPDLTPSATAAPLATFATPTTSATFIFTHHVRTSSTGTIAARATITYDVYQVVTMGFKWTRR